MPRQFKKISKEEAWAFFNRNAMADAKADDLLIATYGRLIYAWRGPLPKKRTGWWWRVPLVHIRWFLRDVD